MTTSFYNEDWLATGNVIYILSQVTFLNIFLMSNVLYAFFITSFIEKTYFPLKRKKKTNLCPLFFSLFHNDYDIVMVNVIIVTQLYVTTQVLPVWLWPILLYGIEKRSK